MKFSARTIQILRNFSTISPSMLFKVGNTLKVMSISRNILARATIESTIEKEFAVYDLPKFLGAISMFEDPELTQYDSYIEISQGSEKIDYQYTDVSLVAVPSDKNVQFRNDPDIIFDLQADTLNRILKGLAFTGSNTLCFTGENGKIFADTSVSDGAATGAPSYRAEVGITDKEFQFVFRAENIKLLPGDYTVAISKDGISNFRGEDIEYWIAVEANSTFKG